MTHEGYQPIPTGRAKRLKGRTRRGFPLLSSNSCTSSEFILPPRPNETPNQVNQSLASRFESSKYRWILPPKVAWISHREPHGVMRSNATDHYLTYLISERLVWLTGIPLCQCRIRLCRRQ